MSEIEFNPGAAKYGNFINYYQFNPPENRIALMPCNLLQLTKVHDGLILCLDIGCNTGELTIATYNFLQKSLENDDKNETHKQRIFMIGIDVDRILIERANELNDNKNIVFICLDIMKEESKSILSVCLKEHNKVQFDITFSFSITMWIHLNHGDDGLNHYLKELTKYSGNILIEPQPWKCYKSAVRRMKRCNGEKFCEFEKLVIRDSVELYITNFFTDSCSYIKCFETSETKWGRKIALYTKADDS